METNSRSKQVTTSLVILIATVLLVSGAVLVSNVMKKTGDMQKSPTPVANNSNETSSSDNEASSYIDGDYEATGQYISPGGDQQIKIKITLAGGTVTDTSAEGDHKTSTSSEYQEKFISNYKQLVVGKSIDSVNLSQVSGSSLTSSGFHDALDEIKEQAKG